MTRVAILGGYTMYGKQVAHYLCKSPGIKKLFIAGKDIQLAAAVVNRLNSSKAAWTQADTSSLVNFTKFLYHDQPQIIINADRTQEPQIARICLDRGAHYIDMTDSTERHDSPEKYENFHQILQTIAHENDLMCVTEASLNPGFTSTVIQHFANKYFHTVDQCNIYVTPDEGLSQTVFQFVGVEGGFRNLIKYEDKYYGQIFEPTVEQLKTKLNIPEINCYYSFHTRSLRWILKFLARFPNLNKGDNWYNEIVSRTFWLQDQNPNVEIIVTGKDEHGNTLEKKWNLYEHPVLTPSSVSSIAACMVVEKILSEQLEGGKVIPCVNLFTFEEMEQQLGVYHEFDDSPYVPMTYEFQTTEEDRFGERIEAMKVWLDVTSYVLSEIRKDSSAYQQSA